LSATVAGTNGSSPENIWMTGSGMLLVGYCLPESPVLVRAFFFSIQPSFLPPLPPSQEIRD